MTAQISRNEVASYPAPWTLHGKGFVFPFRFDSGFALRSCFIADELKSSFRGGIGALMLVDYEESNCGPYRELLLIPGSFAFAFGKRPSISRIFVSSYASVVNGQNNWGIPKDLAEFKVEDLGPKEQLWEVFYQQQLMFRAKLSRGSLPLPLHTAVIPSEIAQCWQGQNYRTQLQAKGWGRPAKLSAIYGDGKNFPDLAQQKPFLGLGLCIDSFTMRFLPAELSPVERQKT